MTEMQEPYSPPPVAHRATRPPGILPRNISRLVIGGVAGVMTIAIALSGRNAPKEQPALIPPLAADVADLNEARIQEYRARIEEQARKLAAEQAKLAETQTFAGSAAGSAARGAGTFAASGAYTQGSEPPSDSGYAGFSGRVPEDNWIAAEKAKREYQSLFASNLSVSRRPVTLTEAHAGQADAVADQDRAQPSFSSQPKDSNAKPSQGPVHRILEGTVIETVLTNRLDGAFSGPVNCQVTTNVYSHDRGKLLIPQGSRVLGDVRQVETFGQQRLAVVFHRLLLPNGYSVPLEKLPGLNAIGETGLLDRVNRHYFQVFGVSLAIGAIAGLAQSNTRYGPDASASDVYRQGIAGSVSQSSLDILDRYLNVLPTFTIQEGHRIKVYLTSDLSLPAYAESTSPGDL